MLKYSFKILKIPNNSLLFFFKTHGDFSSWSRQSHTCSQTLLPRGWHLTFNVQITATAGLKGCVPFFFFFSGPGPDLRDCVMFVSKPFKCKNILKYKELRFLGWLPFDCYFAVELEMMHNLFLDWQVGYHPEFERSRCLFIVRKDGQLVDFSYWKCIKGLIRKNYPLYADSFILRHFRKQRRSLWR